MTDTDITALAAMAEAAARKYPWALPPEIKHLWSDKLKVLVIQETPEAANFTMSASPDTILALIRRVEAAEAARDRLAAVIRVNALRWMPSITHAEIDALINGDQP